MRKITKASEFIKWLRKAADAPTLYVMGCFGAPLNAQTKPRYLSNHEYNKRPERQRMIRGAQTGTFGFDCVCLIKGILWGWNGDTKDIYGGAYYAVNDVPDIDADDMIRVCKDVSENFDGILPGEAVWLPGHIGVYVGDGLCIECTPAWKNGVQYTACGNLGKVKGYPTRTWVKHGKLPYLDYDTAKKPIAPAPDPDPVPAYPNPIYSKLSEIPGYLQEDIKAYISDGSLRGYDDERGLDLTLREARLLAIAHRHAVFLLNMLQDGKIIADSIVAGTLKNLRGGDERG